MRWVSNEIQEDVGVGGWGWYYDVDIFFYSTVFVHDLFGLNNSIYFV